MPFYMSDEEVKAAGSDLPEYDYEPIVYAKLQDLESLEIVTCSEEFLKKKRKFVTTLDVCGSLEQVCAMDSYADRHVCKELREMRKKKKIGYNSYLFSTTGKPCTWKTEGVAQSGDNIGEIIRRCHFAKLQEEVSEKSNNSGTPSAFHETAVYNVFVLAKKNLLKVVTLCSSSTHTFCADVPSWMPEKCAQQCIEGGWVEVDGTAPGMDVRMNVSWQGFVLDLAVLKNGRVETAIEIEKTHSNEVPKKRACEENSVNLIQLDAYEINMVIKYTECNVHDIDFDVVLKHHPTSRTSVHACDLCKKRCKEKAEAARERAAAEWERKRQEKEAAKAFELKQIDEFHKKRRFIAAEIGAVVVGVSGGVFVEEAPRTSFKESAVFKKQGFFWDAQESKLTRITIDLLLSPSVVDLIATNAVRVDMNSEQDQVTLCPRGFMSKDLFWKLHSICNEGGLKYRNCVWSGPW